MGFPKLWWWPGGDAPMRAIDFAEDISDIQESPVVVGDTVDMASGSIRRVTTGGALGVRLVLSNFSNGPLLRELRSLDVHLKKGYPVGFAFDADKVWAGFSQGTLSAGQQVIRTRARNEWRATYGGAQMPSVGDEVVLESAAPEGWREWAEISASVGSIHPSALRLTEGLRYNHTRQPVLMREEGTYPLLVLPEGLAEDLLTSTYHRTWTWQVSLQLDNARLADVWAAGAGPLRPEGSRLMSPTRLSRLSVRP